MSLFSKLFPKNSTEIATDGYFKTLTAYNPVFSSFQGGIYESYLCRASIHAIAVHCSKLKVEINGTANQNLSKMIQTRANPWQTTSQWLYRTATILEADTTAFIVPYLDGAGVNVNGFFTVRPRDVEIMDYHGEPWLKFNFPSGDSSCVEMSRVGILTKFQFDDDIFGSGNSALFPILDLIETQNQAIENGVKSSATIRFLAKIAQVLKPSDIDAERKRFINMNLQTGNSVAMFDGKYSDVKQIISKPMIIDDSQMAYIKNSVFEYFGVNDEILKNNFKDDTWSGFYEGKIESFGLQVSEVLANMLFNDRQLPFNNSVILTANRLQYASTSDKLNFVSSGFDRGLVNRNEAREIFNLSPVEDGEKFYIRTEYSEADRLTENQGLDPQGESKTED